MNKELLKQTLEFLEFCWQDVSMNEHAFERLEQTIALVEAELQKPEPELFGYISEHTGNGMFKYQFHKSTASIYPDTCLKVTPVYAESQEQTPVAWRLGHRLYDSLQDAEFDWKHDSAFDNTSYVPEPLYTK